MCRRCGEQRVRRYLKELRDCLLVWSVLLSTFALYYFSGLWKQGDAWLKYQEAKTDASILRSTMCQIEGVITEEIRPNKNHTVKKTLIQSYFLLRVINSTSKHDQFRTSEVPLLHESEQESLVNSSLACFYDPIGVREARLVLPDLSKAKNDLKMWCLLGYLLLIVGLALIYHFSTVLLKKARQFINSRRQVTNSLEMQPIGVV